MLRRTNSTRSSIRSIPLEHIDSQVASRDAHIAATHAFTRARERTSNSSDNMFPIVTPSSSSTTATLSTSRHFDPDTAAVVPPTFLDNSSNSNLRRQHQSQSQPQQQSIRFVGPTTANTRASRGSGSSVGAGSGVAGIGPGRTRHMDRSRASLSSDHGTPTSVETLKATKTPSSSTIDKMTYNRHATTDLSTSSTVDIDYPISPYYTKNSSDGPRDPGYNHPLVNGGDIAAKPDSIYTNNYYGTKGAISPSSFNPSEPPNSIRRSKSLFASTEQSPKRQFLAGGRSNTTEEDGGVIGSVPQSLRAPKSTSLLLPSRDLDLSHEERVRALALKLAKDRWNHRGQSPNHHHHVPSLFKRSNSIRRDMKKSLRDGNGEDEASPVSQCNSNLPLSGLAAYNQHGQQGPNPPARGDASLRNKARKASHSLRNRFRSIFKMGVSEDDDGGFPDQHVEAKRSHVKQIPSLCFENTDTDNDGNILHLRRPDTGSVSRVPSGMVSLVDVPEHHTVRSHQGSIDETEGHGGSDDKSRVTSWTSSGLTALSSQSGGTWGEWERQRLEEVRQTGTESRLPPSPLVGQSPGVIVDSQRVYSALMKRYDERNKLGRIEEQKTPGSKLTIRPVCSNNEEDDMFTSPPASGNVVGRRPRAASTGSRYDDEDDSIHDDVPGGMTYAQPTTHLNTIPHQPSKVVANRQSAFFGSPTCHLFRTESPYRRALQKSLRDEEEALSLRGSPISVRPPVHFKASFSCRPKGTHPDESEGEDDGNGYDSPSVYSCDEAGDHDPQASTQPPASTSDQDAVAMSTLEKDREPNQNNHGQATIFLNPPTYVPSVQEKGRMVSAASSVEWKSWLSSHVTKLEQEQESPTRGSPYAGDNIYSPATMPPSSVVRAGPTSYGYNAGPWRSREDSEAFTEGRATPSTVSTPLASQSGNVPLPPPSLSASPRRLPPSPPVFRGRDGLSPVASVVDENVPPMPRGERERDRDRDLSPASGLDPPPIPARSPLRKTSSMASLSLSERTTVRTPTPSRNALGLLAKEGGHSQQWRGRDRDVSPATPPRAVGAVRSFSNLSNGCLGARERQGQGQGQRKENGDGGGRGWSNRGNGGDGFASTPALHEGTEG